MILYSEVLIRLIAAAFLGSLIGFERERLNWAAGLRTHMLVCLGACLVIIVSSYGFMDVLQKDFIVLDPSRVAAQVVSGIGFLGAGTILLWQDKVIRGLTTAASLWAVAAVGLAVGGGLFFPALVATFLILLILAGIKPLERRYLKKNLAKEIHIIAQRGEVSLLLIDQTLMRIHKMIKQIRIQSKSDTQDEILLLLDDHSQESVLSAMDELKKLSGIQKMQVFDR